MEYIDITRKKKCRDRKKRKTGREVKASAVIEMSFIMPLFLSVFVLTIYTVFYYHDKAVLNGAAAETAVIGAQMERKKGTQAYDLEEIFRERTKGKLIFLTDPNVSVERDEGEIKVSVSAQKSAMKLNIYQEAAIVNPEEKIRWLS